MGAAASIPAHNLEVDEVQELLGVSPLCLLVLNKSSSELEKYDSGNIENWPDVLHAMIMVVFSFQGNQKQRLELVFKLYESKIIEHLRVDHLEWSHLFKVNRNVAIHLYHLIQSYGLDMSGVVTKCCRDEQIVDGLIDVIKWALQNGSSPVPGLWLWCQRMPMENIAKMCFWCPIENILVQHMPYDVPIGVEGCLCLSVSGVRRDGQLESMLNELSVDDIYECLLNYRFLYMSSLSFELFLRAYLKEGGDPNRELDGLNLIDILIEANDCERYNNPYGIKMIRLLMQAGCYVQHIEAL